MNPSVTSKYNLICQACFAMTAALYRLTKIQTKTYYNFFYVFTELVIKRKEPTGGKGGTLTG